MSVKVKNADEIRKSLQRILSETNDVRDLSLKFSGFNSNCARVDFVHDLLKEHLLLPIDLVKNPGKSDQLAVALREKGNSEFKLKNLKKSWELYTLSIGAAPNDSPNLGLAYGNRSAVLFENHLHEECQSDIKKALEHNYPKHLIPKLLVREKNSRNLPVIPWSYHEEIPTLPSLNREIQSASDCVEMKSSNSEGRHIIARKTIEAGDILAIERPYVTLLIDGVSVGHCYKCLKLSYTLIPCDYCTQTFFCNDLCKKEALQTFHKYECQLSTTIKTLNLCKLTLLPFRIALITKQIDLIDHSKTNFYRSDRYKEIHDLVTNFEKRSIADLFERTVNAAILYDLLKSHTDFFGKDRLSKDFFKDILLHHMMTAPSNFHEISELTRNPSNGNYEPVEIASATFAFLSLINHSCSPNVTRHCYGGTVVLRAIQTIDKGEQICDNYGYHYALTPKKERQNVLKSQYHFECACKACTNNWGLYEDLPSHNGGPQIEDGVIEMLTKADRHLAKTVLRESLVKLKDCQALMPCRNFCQIQEVVKQCFAIFGNVRRIL